MARQVTHRYVDPLAQVWIGAARRIGLRVVRTPDAYAATDGRGTLAIGDDATLDADDSLGQMIFHELCHSLVEGEDSFSAPDWGMDNTGPDHDWREHACLRTQWVLAGRHGLRGLFAPTTEFRAFWDGLAGDVLADRRDRSVVAAIAAVRRAAHPPWAPALGEALAATERIAAEGGAVRRGRPAAAPGDLGRAPPRCGAASRGARAAPDRPARRAPRTRRARRARGDTTSAESRAAARPARRSIQRGARAERYEPALDCQDVRRVLAAPRTTPSR